MVLLLALLAATAAATAAVVHATVPVSVFYESHCRDSQDFIMNHLYPSWPRIEKYVELNFVPFGKARSTRDGFECQHGPKECRSNLFQSCALSFLKPGTDQVNFVNCFMADPNDYDTCVDRSGLSERSIRKCINSNLGRDLQLYAERETKFRIPQLKFVPTVTFNKVYNDDDQRDIQSYQFMRALCRYEPKVCKDNRYQ